MNRTALTLFALLATAGFSPAAPPPDDLVKRMTEVVRTHCPDATIEATDEGFLAKSGTMKFTVHGRSKTGEISPKTHQEEGPNFRGFVLRVTLNDGPYRGAAVVPQTLQGPYYPTEISAPAVGDKHYLVRFSYGTRLDPEIKKAILDVLPK
jgi:hypothetical protein